MPSCSGACGNLRDGNVSHWMYLQFLHPTSGTLKKTHFGRPTTPAMAAALTDHIWSIQEVLWHKVVPASLSMFLQPSQNDREAVLEKRSRLSKLNRNDHEA